MPKASTSTLALFLLFTLTGKPIYPAQGIENTVMKITTKSTLPNSSKKSKPVPPGISI
jgi:hypothetical protein